MPRIFFVLALTYTVALSSCWEGTSRDVLATVLSAGGEVVSSSKGSTNFGPIGPETKLGADSVLKTASDGQVDLILIPGALARISGNSELKIGQLKLTKDGNETGDAMRERVARMELRRGGMVVLFEGFAHFTIVTREATIRVLPSCLLLLDVDESEVRATCVRGKVYATPKNGQPVAIDAGYFSEWPSERGSVSVVEDRRGQTDTIATLEAARKLQELAVAQRDRLPF